MKKKKKRRNYPPPVARAAAARALLLRCAASTVRSFSDWAIRFLVFSSTERFRKKSKRHSKGLGEIRPNPGCFWFTAVGGRFFWRRKNFRVASLGSEWQKTAHIKLILCVSNKLFY
jgi:hypothetical protein